jgi:phenylalanyl-tRNA synthetase alpha subunit
MTYLNSIPNNPTIEQWVQLVKNKYREQGIFPEVTGYNGQIKVNLTDRELVETIHETMDILENPQRHPANVVNDYQRLMNKFKSDLHAGIRNQDSFNKTFMIRAGVRSYTYYIGGRELLTVNIEL